MLIRMQGIGLRSWPTQPNQHPRRTSRPTMNYLWRAQQVKFLLENLILEENEYKDDHGAAINAEWILVPTGSGDLTLSGDTKGISVAMKEQHVDARLTAELM